MQGRRNRWRPYAPSKLDQQKNANRRESEDYSSSQPDATQQHADHETFSLVIETIPGKNRCADQNQRDNDACRKFPHSDRGSFQTNRVIVALSGLYL